MGKIGCKTLPIKKGSVGASNVFDEEAAAFLVDLGMATRNATLQSSVGCEVQVGKDTVGGVQAPATWVLGDLDTMTFTIHEVPVDSTAGSSAV